MKLDASESDWITFGKPQTSVSRKWNVEEKRAFHRWLFIAQYSRDWVQYGINRWGASIPLSEMLKHRHGKTEAPDSFVGVVYFARTGETHFVTHTAYTVRDSLMRSLPRDPVSIAKLTQSNTILNWIHVPGLGRLGRPERAKLAYILSEMLTNGEW